jgi:hypothetical protein
VLASVATFFVFLGRRSAALSARAESAEKDADTGTKS